MRSGIFIVAGLLVMLLGIYGCSSNNSPTAPMNSQNVFSRSTGTLPQTNIDQLAMVGFTYPNPVKGTLATTSQGCFIINIDKTHFVNLDLDVSNLPFKLEDGMALIAFGQYTKETVACPGPVFEVSALAKAGAGNTAKPTNSFNDQ